MGPENFTGLFPGATSHKLDRLRKGLFSIAHIYVVEYRQITRKFLLATRVEKDCASLAASTKILLEHDFSTHHSASLNSPLLLLTSSATNTEHFVFTPVLSQTNSKHNPTSPSFMSQKAVSFSLSF